MSRTEKPNSYITDPSLFKRDRYCRCFHDSCCSTDPGYKGSFQCQVKIVYIHVEKKIILQFHVKKCPLPKKKSGMCWTTIKLFLLQWWGRWMYDLWRQCKFSRYVNVTGSLNNAIFVTRKIKSHYGNLIMFLKK